MDALKQSLKIGVGLAAMVAVCVALLPERPSLFSSEAGVESAEAADNDELLLATAGSMPREDASDETVELAQAPSALGGSGAATGDDGLTAGQRHLQRLRERNQSGAATAQPSAPSPAPAPQAPPAASQQPAPASAPTPPAPPPASPAPEAGGQGLDSLTRPSAPPEFRLFRDAQAVDSATLRSGSQTVRVAGIVPVAADEARAALNDWLSGHEVVCAVSPGVDSAPCVRGEEDIAEWAVENGWATAEAGSVYEEAEARARDAGLGIWASGGR